MKLAAAALVLALALPRTTWSNGSGLQSFATASLMRAPRASSQSPAVTVSAPPLEDRLVSKRGLELLEDTKAGFGRKLEEFTCDDGVDFVDCENGYVRGNPAQSCYQACNDGAHCCAGTSACLGFTGRVCKNGSCFGQQACHRATIGLVDNSCIGPADENDNNKGACLDFGLESTTTSGMRLKNSCHGNMACWRTARFTGSINGDIIDSCYGKWSCYGIAAAGTVNGDIINSCKSTIGNDDEAKACYHLAGGGTPANEKQFAPTAGGFNGGIIDSCHGHDSCHYLGFRGAITGVVSGSCNAVSACQFMAREAGSTISHLNDCCDTESGCSIPDGEVIGDSDIPATCTAPFPTSSPTSAPTPHGLWTLVFQEMAATLASDAEDDITFTYVIATGRDYEFSFLEKGCDAAAPVDGALYNVTDSTGFINSTHQSLVVSYSIDKSALTSSPIWNNDTSTIELCQVTSLVDVFDEPVGKLVLAQDKREVGVYVDTGVNFTITTNLTEAETFNETKEVDVTGAVNAFKCLDDFSPNNDALSPNDEMFTCVGSADSAFEVETLDSMVISQDNKPDLNIIVGGNIQIPSITSREYTEDGVIVGTRIPINLFNFADGAFLGISGAVTMKLADGSTRRLRVDLGSIARNLQDEANEASYNVNVALQTAEESSIQDLGSNSAAGVATTALKGLVLAAFFLLL